MQFVMRQKISFYMHPSFATASFVKEKEKRCGCKYDVPHLFHLLRLEEKIGKVMWTSNDIFRGIH